MNKLQYENAINTAKEGIKTIKQGMDDIRNLYIKTNKPCKKNDKVKITLESGRVVVGVASSFGILKDSTVCITSYKIGNKTKYITTPHKSVELV